VSIRSLASSPSVPARAAEQAELARRTLDAVVKNTEDIAELVQKSSSEATAIILNRIRESIAETRAAIEGRKT